MAIEFRCLQCGKLLRTGDDTAGKQAKCPECGAVMAIPAASEGSLGDNPFGAAGPQPLPMADLGNPYQSPSPFAPLAPSRPLGAITPSTLDLGDVFSRTWTIFKEQWGMCLGVLVVVWLISFGVNMVAQFIPIAGPLIAGLFGLWLGIGQALFLLKMVRGENAAMGDIFTGWPYFLKVFLGQLLLGLIFFGIVLVCVLPLVLVGLAISRDAVIILAIVGGVVAAVIIVYVALTVSQFYYLILDRNMDVIDAFKMSKELTEGNKATLLVIGLLSFAIVIVALIPCGLGLLAAVPYFALMQPVVYLAITGQPTADQLQAKAVV